ncbi:MAG: hypothetical protein ACRD18_08535 [Terriglobia bacterium]
MNSPSRAVGSNQETLYVSSGMWLQRLSLGYEGLLADIYWTRAIQYFGTGRLTRETNFSLLGPLLRITTTLDPHLLVAYRFGAIFLAEKPPGGAGRPDEAMQLLRRGIVANPNYWRLWEDLGFIEYWDLHDYAAAARIFKAGSERPGAEIWMKTLAATVAAKGGEILTSQVLWTQVYRTAENNTVRKSAIEHLAALKAVQEMQELDVILASYQKREGHPARSFGDVVSAGLLRAMPRDPSGAPYVLRADGKTAVGPESKIDLRLLQ